MWHFCRDIKKLKSTGCREPFFGSKVKRRRQNTSSHTSVCFKWENVNSISSPHSACSPFIINKHHISIHGDELLCVSISWKIFIENVSQQSHKRDLIQILFNFPNHHHPFHILFFVFFSTHLIQVTSLHLDQKIMKSVCWECGKCSSTCVVRLLGAD